MTSIVVNKIFAELAIVILMLSASLVLIRHLHRAALVIAGQSLLLAVLGILTAIYTGERELIIAAIITVVFKAIGVPLVLVYYLKRLQSNGQFITLINQRFSLVVTAGIILVAYYMTSVAHLTLNAFTERFLPVALATMLLGAFIMINQKQITSQVTGLLLLENGIYLAGFATTLGMPLIVELGAVFDLLVGILVIGVLFYRIDQVFDNLSTDHLQNLKG